MHARNPCTPCALPASAHQHGRRGALCDDLQHVHQPLAGKAAHGVAQLALLFKRHFPTRAWRGRLLVRRSLQAGGGRLWQRGSDVAHARAGKPCGSRQALHAAAPASRGVRFASSMCCQPAAAPRRLHPSTQAKPPLQRRTFRVSSCSSAVTACSLSGSDCVSASSCCSGGQQQTAQRVRTGGGRGASDTLAEQLGPGAAQVRSLAVAQLVAVPASALPPAQPCCTQQARTASSSWHAFMWCSQWTSMALMAHFFSNRSLAWSPITRTWLPAGSRRRAGRRGSERKRTGRPAAATFAAGAL